MRIDALVSYIYRRGCLNNEMTFGRLYDFYATSQTLILLVFTTLEDHFRLNAPDGET